MNITPVNPAPTSEMTTEANKDLCRRFADVVVSQGHLEVLGEFVSPDYKRYLTATAAPIDAEGQKKRLAGLRAAFPDLKVTIDDLIAEGDRVVYRSTCHGTHQGTLMGIAPTGKQGVVTEIEIFRIENGKIVEQWGGPDMFDLLRIIGAIK